MIIVTAMCVLFTDIFTPTTCRCVFTAFVGSGFRVCLNLLCFITDGKASNAKYTLPSMISINAM